MEGKIKIGFYLCSRLPSYLWAVAMVQYKSNRYFSYQTCYQCIQLRGHSCLAASAQITHYVKTAPAAKPSLHWKHTVVFLFLPLNFQPSPSSRSLELVRIFVGGVSASAAMQHVYPQVYKQAWLWKPFSFSLDSWSSSQQVLRTAIDHCLIVQPSIFSVVRPWLAAEHLHPEFADFYWNLFLPRSRQFSRRSQIRILLQQLSCLKVGKLCVCVFALFFN